MVAGEVIPASRVKWLITLRTVVISFILAFTVLAQARGMRDFEGPQLVGLYLVAAAAYLLTMVYAALYGRLVDRPAFGFSQLLVDNILISLIILITGGVDSIFSVLYFLTIIGGGIIYYRRGGLIVTAQASLLYLGVALAPFLRQSYQWLDLEGRYNYISFPYVFYRAGMNVLAFFLVSLLSSYLSESLRRTREALSARESDLAELQSLYENIVQNIASGLITTDLSGKIISFNRAAEKITRRPASRSLGAGFMDIFLLPAGVNPFAYPWNIGDSGWRCEGHLADNKAMVLGMTFSPLRNEGGEVSGIICSFQDLTEIKKLEQQIQRSDRLAAVGEMAAGVAHEIRNPLASISGSIQILREDLPLDETNRSLMEIVTQETERLNRIISDFLLFANPRSLQREEVELGPVVEETLTLLRNSLDGRSDYTFNVSDASGGARVSADRAMLRQACWNLALNAVQAMPDGGSLQIRIKLERGAPGHPGEPPKEWLTAEFVDSGQGISEEQVDKIFTPFFSTKENGTGLGLSIVFKIIEQHQGSMEFESRKGEGSTFRLKLPVVSASAGRRDGKAGEGR